MSKVEPKETKNFSDYKKQSQKRTGCKNKNERTINLHDIYVTSELRDAIKETLYNAIVREVCKEVRKMLVKGHPIPIYKWGTLAHRIKDARVFKFSNGCVNDRRIIDHDQLLENKFNKEVYNDDNGINPKRNDKRIRVVLIHNCSKEDKLKHVGIVPDKNCLREMMNVILGTEYKIYGVN